MDRPILFSTPMVKAILRGRKSQTRRVVRPSVKGCTVGAYTDFEGINIINVQKDGDPWTDIEPRIKVGDLLWVRETWMPFGFVRENRMFIHYKASQDQNGGERILEIPSNVKRPEATLKWRPSIFMPRWASRITLEVTEVRVQRLQEISEEDCIAEGIEPIYENPTEEINKQLRSIGAKEVDKPWLLGYKDYRKQDKRVGYSMTESYLPAIKSYETLWNSINAKSGHGWDKNEWVWAISFKRVETKC